MTLEIELPTSLQAKLEQEAERAGLALKEYALRLLQREDAPLPPKEPLQPTPDGDLTPEERVRRFDAMIASFPKLNVPDIPDEALRRENMYEDRGL